MLGKTGLEGPDSLVKSLDSASKSLDAENEQNKAYFKASNLEKARLDKKEEQRYEQSKQDTMEKANAGAQQNLEAAKSREAEIAALAEKAKDSAAATGAFPDVEKLKRDDVEKAA